MQMKRRNLYRTRKQVFFCIKNSSHGIVSRERNQVSRLTRQDHSTGIRLVGTVVITRARGCSC